MAQRRTLQRVGAVAATVLAIAGTTMTPASSNEDPLRALAGVGDVGGGGEVGEVDVQVDVPGAGAVGGGVGAPPRAFPPAGFAVTSVQWSMKPGDLTPTFTPPNPATSHPSAWSCTTSVGTTTAKAVCTPTSPYDPGTSGWSCYDPFVVVDVSTPLGSTGDAVTGSSHCGTTWATCTANTGLGAVVAPTAHCQYPAFPAQPAPLECDADFANAKVTSTWTVRCAPIDP